jgi:acyl-CoA thioesterase
MTTRGTPDAAAPAAVSAEAAQQLAERVAAAMFASDRASQALGMRIEGVAPGRAELTMTVRDDMLNGHSICHGGFIFLLADSTFAFACNSYNRNTVAQGCSIDYLAPAHGGDVLRATGVERSRSGRTGVYDIDVRNQEGRTVALFRGKSYRIDGHVVDETQIL